MPRDDSEIVREIFPYIRRRHDFVGCIFSWRKRWRHGCAAAQPMPDAENGRYALSPVADGVIRLDTRTGAVSTCTNSGNGWACYVVPDERAALDAEIGRLQDDNEKLKAQLAAREPVVTGKIDEPLPKAELAEKGRAEGAPTASARSKSRCRAISDMDRMMSFLEQAWRRLVEMANRMQKDVAGRI